MLFEDIGIQAPKILLPKEGTDLSKWCVIACDQYTSDRAYWTRAGEAVGDAPSTLSLIFPEVYLDGDEGDSEDTVAEKKRARIATINASMLSYLEQDMFREVGPGFVLVERTCGHPRKTRKGLMIAIDLEAYDYTKGSQTLVRATEGTIEDRLPPRVAIRENAKLELPHIMVLIDDPGMTVIEPLFNEELPVLYDVELMADGGHLRGFEVSDAALVARVADGLRALGNEEAFTAKYGEGKKPLLFAMGDGNHSLATAKRVWQMRKEAGASMDDPARFALVELVNVHDSGLEFEPIHRVIFKCDTEDLLQGFAAFLAQNGCEAKFVDAPVDGAQNIEFITAARKGFVAVTGERMKNLEVGTLQWYLDAYLAAHATAKIDYVHEADSVRKLGAAEGNVGFLLPAMSKADLFATVVLDGALPRKTFSMGESDEKRYYLECRMIQQVRARRE